jgi:TatD DNase family protein
MPHLVDAHDHLQDPRLRGRVPELLDRAAQAGVRGFWVAATREADWDDVAVLADTFPGVVPFFGLHPWYIAERGPSWEERLAALLQSRPSGLGEIGLDALKSGVDPVEAENLLRRQLGLARALGRPVVIHGVRAWGRILQILREEGGHAPGAILHSYGGGPELVAPLVAVGCWFSFSGMVTRPGASRMREAAVVVPAQRLLIETDAPDLLPEGAALDPFFTRRPPLRDDRGGILNEPALLPRVLAVLASLRGMSQGELATRIEANTGVLATAMETGL